MAVAFAAVAMGNIRRERCLSWHWQQWQPSASGSHPLPHILSHTCFTPCPTPTKEREAAGELAVFRGVDDSVDEHVANAAGKERSTCQAYVGEGPV